jgi:hypothetical protein
MNPPPAAPLDNEFIISFFRLRQALGYIGIAMLSLVAIALIKLFSWQTSIFAPEAVAIIAFGIAWLTKGQAFLKDKDLITANAA